MSKEVDIKDLATEIAAGLTEYDQNVADEIKTIVDDVAQEGVDELKQSSPMDTVNGKQGGSTTNEIQLKIENFYNNREQDIRELTEEILEIADQIKEREEAAYA